MIIKSVTYVSSSTQPGNAPPPVLPEFSFIGRSNVGKSSLINMLVGRRDLARTSATPGKTQTINHYLVNEQWYLVDLPGYGYASVARKTKRSWPEMISRFLLERNNLVNTFILIDSRLEPQAIDKEFITWAGQSSIPFAIVFTKTDKLSRTATEGTIRAWTNELSKTWSELPLMFRTSVLKKTGAKELTDYIDKLLKVSDL